VTLTFRVYGVAQPKGSTKAFTYRLHQKDGQPVRDRYGDAVYRAAVTSDNPKNRDWQQLVAEAASRTITPGAVSLTIWCYLPRPKKYMRAKYAIGPAHVTKPDSDKLARSVKDALTGVVWRDDAQVTDLIIHKRYVKMRGGRLDAPHIDVSVAPTAPLDQFLPAPPPPTATPRPLFPESLK
jgi:Holliday junction resolvase RusA-like endonuclease